MVYLQPSEIRFIQAGISCDFKDGRSVNDAAERLSSGHLHPSDFPTIKIIRLDSKYYSFDNRRLYAFRVAEYRYAITQIPVNIVSSSLLIRSRFDTQTDGREVFVRRDRTFPHCKNDWLVIRPKTPPPSRIILGEIQPSATYVDYYEKPSVIKPVAGAITFGEGLAMREPRPELPHQTRNIDENNRRTLETRPSSTRAYKAPSQGIGLPVDNEPTPTYKVPSQGLGILMDNEPTPTYKTPSQGFATSVNNEPTSSEMNGENKYPELQREKQCRDSKNDTKIRIPEDNVSCDGAKRSRCCCTIL